MRPRVLVVDDDPGTRGLMLIYLKHLGYAADSVTNGREAVDAVGAGIYGLVLLDCVMPEMDGLEATRRIRALELPGGKPGIVAFSSQATPKARASCLAAGMDAFLAKPFTEDDLRKALEAASGGGVPERREQPEGARRVILVDDDASVRQFVWEALTTAGYEVVQVASGEDARCLVEGEPRPYDLLIVDIVMPGMGGPAFAGWLRKEHPRTRVLFISGYGDETARMFGLPPGEHEFLPKPFGPAELLERVGGVLGKRDRRPGGA
jgi:DNA-binding response OmpR family regulator